MGFVSRDQICRFTNRSPKLTEAFRPDLLTLQVSSITFFLSPCSFIDLLKNSCPGDLWNLVFQFWCECFDPSDLELSCCMSMVKPWPADFTKLHLNSWVNFAFIHFLILKRVCTSLHSRVPDSVIIIWRVHFDFHPEEQVVLNRDTAPGY